jgi:signal recognition particle receptor subunit beta
VRIVGDKIYIKLIFFGTALAGKTTALQYLFKNVIPKDMKKSERIRSIDTSFGQTLLFDFVHIDVGENIFFHIYTATGQDYYAGTRKMLMEEVDGVFFVVDSQKKELQHNKEFAGEFNKYLETVKGLREATVIVLYNKQDLEKIYSPDYLEKELDFHSYPSFPTCAVTGMNIEAAFTLMVGLLLRKLKENQEFRSYEQRNK